MYGVEHLNTQAFNKYEENNEIVIDIEPYERVSAGRAQTGFHHDTIRKVIVETVQIQVTNARNEDVEVVIQDSMYRYLPYQLFIFNYT